MVAHLFYHNTMLRYSCVQEKNALKILNVGADYCVKCA